MSDAFTWGSGGNKLTAADRKRRMAEALMQKGGDYSPVGHWSQGLARVAQALMGGMMARDADAADKAGAAAVASDAALLMGGGAPPAVASAPASSVASPADPSVAVAATPAALAPIFTTKEAEYKLPTNYLPQVAKIESSFNPTAANPNSSARGLFQFTKGTARDYGLANPMDPIASTDAAARLAADNAQTLTRALGRAPTAGELYLAHQQGGGGASKLLANPTARAIDVVGRDAVINNGGNPNMTAAEFARRWTNKVAANEADLPADGAVPVAMETGQPGFAVPPESGPPMDAATFNAIQNGQPLDPVFQAEGVSQPWMGTALPAQVAAPQVAQAPAPMPPPRPAALAMPQADLPAPGAVPAMGQVPPAAPVIDPNSPDAGMRAQIAADAQGPLSSPFSGIVQALSGGSSAPPQAPASAAQRVAAALPAQDASAVPGSTSSSASPPASSAGVDRVASAIRVLNSPYAQPGQRAVAQMVVQQAFRDPAKLEADKLDLDLKRKQLGKSDEPTSIQEYNLAKSQGETRSFTDWKTAQAKAGATSVNVNGGGSDKQIFDTFAENTKEARAAATGLVALREARSALSGGAITGAGADARLALQKIAAGFGGDPTKVINTETFRAAIAPQVAAVLKSTVGTANISDADRRFAERAAGGSIDLDEGSISRLLDIMEKASQARLQLHQQQLEAVYPDPEGNKRERALFSVKPPPAPERDPNAPVRVRTPDEARKLPKGTKIILPDGTPGVVP